MLKKFLLAAVALFAAVQLAFAAVDVNTADKAALDGIKSIGPKTADAIIAERTKGGKFKDWEDLIKRVKGVGPGNASKMSASGLTVNGEVMANAAPKAAMTKKKDKPAVTDAPPADAGKGAKASIPTPPVDTGKTAKSAMPPPPPAAAPSAAPARMETKKQ